MFDELPARLRLVLEHVAEGLTFQEIADLMLISPRSVQNRLGVIRKTLGAKTNAHAVAIAVRHGIIL
jgi:two-component system invasion response regulator UvrY